MDRVGFLIEDSNQHLGCLLNPETLEISRIAGIKPRRSANGLLSGKALRDDPLLFTGGGRTELKMDLLFDIHLAGSTIQSRDVRDLTQPLWQLAENRLDDEGISSIRLVRFVWGKTWNIPGVIATIAERFEYFTAEGIPQRSWMRMRFLRVEDVETLSPKGETLPSATPPLPPAGGPETEETIKAIGGANETGGPGISGNRLDAVAQKAYGNAAMWRWLAVYNRIDDPLRVPAGQPIQVPSLGQKGVP